MDASKVQTITKKTVMRPVAVPISSFSKSLPSLPSGTKGLRDLGTKGLRDEPRLPLSSSPPLFVL